MSWHCTEHGRVERIGWLRAAVLGANDGIVSTTSLVMGIIAAGSDTSAALLAGSAGMVAGAMSMAAGEYVSVHSQADVEQAELTKEKQELEHDPVTEQHELAAIYIKRGLSERLAEQVAEELTRHDALGAHARDELGISQVAKPTQAALASALSFAVGSALPLSVILLYGQHLLVWIPITSLVFLALLGGLAAKVGGASISTGALRVTFWGALAMAVTAGIGNLLGIVI